MRYYCAYIENRLSRALGLQALIASGGVKVP